MAKTITIARADDELGTIDESELQAALDSGFRVVAEGDVKGIQDRREAQSTGGMVRGGAEAAARGATLGISDLVARGMGADTGQMRARKENLGTLGTGLELAGAAAPALLTGGTSTAAQVAARTPAGLTARLGMGVAERVGTRRATQMAAQGATEGFLQGVGQVVSEDALGDRDLSAERLLAGGAQGAALGGLLGGGMGAAGDGLAAVARGSQRVSKKMLARVAGLGDDVSDPAVKSALAKGGDIVERAQHAQVSAFGGSVDQHAALTHLNKLRRTKEGRRLMTAAEGGNLDDAVGARVRSSIGATDTKKALDRFGQTFTVDARKSGLHASARRLEKFQERLSRKTFGAGEAAENAMLVKKLLRRGNKDGKLFERMAAGDAKAPNAHRYLTKTVEDIEAAMAGREGTFGHEAIMAELQPLRQLADDPLLWGGKAGTARTLYAARDAERAALDALPSKVRAAMETPGDTASARLLARNEEAVESVLGARERITKTLEDAGEDVAELRRGLDDTRAAFRYGGELREASEAWKTLRQVGEGSRAKAARAGMEGLGMITGGGLGGLGGAYGGRLTAELLGGMTRPAAVMATMARLRQAVDLVAGREGAIIKGAEKLAEGGAKAARQAAKAARATGRQSLRTGREAAVKRQARLEQVRRSVVQLADKTEDVPDRLGPGMNEIRAVAPGVADAMAGVAGRAVSFLASKAPSAYEPRFSGSKSIVDPVEMAQFGRYVEAVEDPLSAVAKLETGALNLEAAEAIREVYPKMYAELQEGVMEMVGKRAENGDPVSHEARVQLSRLLAIPLDDSMVPGFRERLSPNPQPQQPPPPPVPQSNVNASANVDVGQGQVTGMTRLEAGGEHQ